MAFAWPPATGPIERRLGEDDAKTRMAAIDEVRALPREAAAKLLLRALEDEDPGVRRRAARVAGEMRLALVSERVVSWLGEADVKLRLAACELLRVAPTEKATAALGRALSDPDAKVRRAAARALGEVESVESVPPLVGRLDDANAEVRSEVVRALARIGDRAAALGLVAKLSDESDEVRRAAARALFALRDPRATGALLRALRDTDAQVRVEALRALGELRAEEATSPLAALLDQSEPPAVRRAAAEALGSIASEAAISALVRGLDAEAPELVHAPVREVLARFGADARGPLMNELSAAASSPRVAGGAALILAQMRAAEATEAIVEAMRRGNISERVGLRALALSSDARALPYAAELLKFGKGPIRAQAIEAISALLDPRAPDGRLVAPLKEALGRREISEEERLGLIHALGRSGSREALDVLLGSMKAGALPVRLAAIRALGALGPVGQDGVLMNALEDDRAGVRLEAAMALGATATEATTLHLLDRLIFAAEADRGAVGLALSMALARATREETVRAVVGAMAAAREGARDVLIEGLGRMKGRAPGEALGSLLGSASRADRRKIAEALAGHPEATSTWEALLQDRDDDVRAAAAWSLGVFPTQAPASAFERALAGTEDHADAVAANAMASVARLASRHPEGGLRALCEGLRHAHAHVRANALLGLDRLGKRCGDGALERALLRSDPSETVRSAAVRLISRVPMDDGARDHFALARCLDTETSRNIAARCGAAPNQDPAGGGQHPILFFVIAPGQDEPLPSASFAAKLSDGFVRSCVTDRRGAVFEAAAPSGVFILVPEGR